MEAEIQPRMEEVRGRIQAWRAVRKKSGPMPESLWAEVIELTKGLGINATARVLGLNPTRIRVRLNGEPGHGQSSPAEFLELSGADMLVGRRSRPRCTPCNPSTATIIELRSRHGSQVTIQLGSGHPFDLITLVKAFRD